MGQEFLEFIKYQKALGYTKGNEVLSLSKENINILNYLNKYTLDINFKLKSISENTLKEVTKECLNNYFKLHNVKKLIADYSFPSKRKIFGFQINKAWNNCLKEVEPYSIPINYLNKDRNFGYLVTACPKLEKNINFKIANVGMIAILLDSELTPFSITSYAHELIHTQLEDKRVYTNNYYNKEILSRFIELLVSYTISNDEKYKTLNIGNISLGTMGIINNMNFLKNDLNTLMNVENLANVNDEKYIFLIEISTYVNSMLVALELFDNYLNAFCNEKRKIIYGIQEVLDGKITIEELLGQNKIGTTPGKRLEIVRKWVR